ncbi:chromosome partitioning protein [Actinosynnema sp. NPDC023794]
MAALLALVLAARRQEPVLLADADPDGGPLPWRFGFANLPTLTALAPRLLNARGGDLRTMDRLLPRIPAGPWLLPGGAPVQPQLCRDVTRSLSRLFAVCVTDCAGGVASPATAAVLDEAHAVVVTSAANPSAVRDTRSGLARLAATRGPSVLARTVVALNTITPDGLAALRVDAVTAAFAGMGVPVVTLPHDRHLAAGAVVTASWVGERTMVEATRLAGSALARARQL